MLLQIQPEGWLQYGALGVLALVLVGLGVGAYKFGNALISLLSEHLDNEDEFKKGFVEEKKRLTETVFAMHTDLNGTLHPINQRTHDTQLDLKGLRDDLRSLQKEIETTLKRISIDNAKTREDMANFMDVVRHQMNTNIELLKIINSNVSTKEKD